MDNLFPDYFVGVAMLLLKIGGATYDSKVRLTELESKGSRWKFGHIVLLRRGLF